MFARGKELNLQFNGDTSFSIVVAGSFGRMEASPESDLKVTSDAFQGELTRFIDSHRGNWAETIFEYLIF